MKSVESFEGEAKPCCNSLCFLDGVAFESTSTFSLLGVQIKFLIELIGERSLDGVDGVVVVDGCFSVTVLGLDRLRSAFFVGESMGEGN
jgi:hypothetical protein